jgi:hypothetical protein
MAFRRAVDLRGEDPVALLSRTLVSHCPRLTWLPPRSRRGDGRGR